MHHLDLVLDLDAQRVAVHNELVRALVHDAQSAAWARRCVAFLLHLFGVSRERVVHLRDDPAISLAANQLCDGVQGPEVHAADGSLRRLRLHAILRGLVLHGLIRDIVLIAKVIEIREKGVREGRHACDEILASQSDLFSAPFAWTGNLFPSPRALALGELENERRWSRTPGL